jgi:hypothetical protein
VTLGGALEMVDLANRHAAFPLQAGALFGKPLPDGVFDGGADLYEVGRRLGLRIDSLSAHLRYFLPSLDTVWRFKRLKEIGFH